VAYCKYCNEYIEWFDDDGHWVPLSPDTQERHECRVNARRRHLDPFSRGYDEGYNAGFEAGMNEASSQSEELPAGTLKLTKGDILKLLQLCHPDHQPIERQDIATIVTSRLNRLMDDIKVSK
jgi:hypothetical protein